MMKKEEKEEVVEEKKEEEVVEKITEEGPKKFYKHETITDSLFTSVEILTPVKVSNTGKVSINKDEDKIFVGKTFISVGGQPQPFTFRIIEASNLKQALDVFDDSLAKAIEEAKKDAMEARKQQEKEAQTKIVTPGGGSDPIIHSSKKI
jgi:hypothetical protein